MKPVLAVMLTFFLFSCSSSNDKPDGGEEPVIDAGDDGAAGDDGTAGDDGAAGDDGGSAGDDGGTRPDYDPEQSFLLNVPDGTGLCFGFHQDRTWRQALDMISLIDLTPGYYVLPRQAGFYQAEMIDRVVLSPEHWELLPTAAAGEIQAQYETSGNGEWLYTFTKDFTYSGEIYHLEVRFNIRNDGSGWPAEIIVDSGDYNFETTAKLTFRDKDPLTETQAFGLCDLPAGVTYAATTAVGDQVVLDVRTGPYIFSCLAAGETSCLFLTGAQVSMGSFQQTVADRLSLVYVGSHHNWYDEYLILLDPPAGNTHVVWIDAPDFTGKTGYLVKMDAGFNEVSKDEITDWQQN